jgi:hypothetical protein
MATRSVVKLDTSLTVRDIIAVRTKLSQALSGTEPVVISVPPEASVDISFVQLVEAARTQAIAHGKTISMEAPATGKLRDVLERGGLLTDAKDSDIQFWLQTEKVP